MALTVPEANELAELSAIYEIRGCKDIYLAGRITELRNKSFASASFITLQLTNIAPFVKVELTIPDLAGAIREACTDGQILELVEELRD